MSLNISVTSIGNELDIDPHNICGIVYFASDGPQFLCGNGANQYIRDGIDAARFLPLFREPLWPGQVPFAHNYSLRNVFSGLICQEPNELDPKYKREPIYLGIPIDPDDLPEEIEYSSWLNALSTPTHGPGRPIPNGQASILDDGKTKASTC